MNSKRVITRGALGVYLLAVRVMPIMERFRFSAVLLQKTIDFPAEDGNG